MEDLQQSLALRVALLREMLYLREESVQAGADPTQGWFDVRAGPGLQSSHLHRKLP